MPSSQDPAATPDDFEAALKELARPPQVGEEFVAKLAAQATHSLDPMVDHAVRQAQLPSSPMPGDLLEGRYRVLSVLGRGGMGVVLEAEQLRTKKVVAIKWMQRAHESERSPAQVARFQREARVVANIQHPNVVDLYDVGDNDGTPFLVLERLRGESLRERLQRGGVMAWDEARTVMLGILSGVGAVHRAGVVHRDLKPDNIFLCNDGPTLVPKVLDFGVAAMRTNSEEGLDTLTKTGALLGTPSYMAPEQLTGGDVDARADIYALGVVLFEMLTGRLPFEARTAADLAVLQATRVPAFPQPGARALGREREQVVLRALARDPEERFADVEALAAAIGAHGAQVPRARKRMVMLALLGALAVGGSMGALLFAGNRAGPSSLGARKPPGGEWATQAHEVAARQPTAPSAASDVTHVQASSLAPGSTDAQPNLPPANFPTATVDDVRPTKGVTPKRPRTATGTKPTPPAVEQSPAMPTEGVDRAKATQIRLDDF